MHSLDDLRHPCNASSIPDARVLHFEAQRDGRLSRQRGSSPSGIGGGEIKYICYSQTTGCVSSDDTDGRTTRVNQGNENSQQYLVQESRRTKYTLLVKHQSCLSEQEAIGFPSPKNAFTTLSLTTPTTSIYSTPKLLKGVSGISQDQHTLASSNKASALNNDPSTREGMK